VRVLDHEQATAREVRVVGAHRRLDLIRRREAVRRRQQADRRAGPPGDAAGLVVVDVAALLADDLVAGAAVHVDGDLVGHRA